MEWMGWAAAALLLLGLGNVLWVLAVRRYYRLRGPAPQLLRVRCEDGWALAVYARPAARRRYREPVLLCHGLAANRFTFDFEPPYSVAHAPHCSTQPCTPPAHDMTPPTGTNKSLLCSVHP